MLKLDVDFVRKQFPALTTGKFKDVAFFENAGGTYVPQQVLEHLNKFMIEAKVQPYGPYAMSTQASTAIEQATIKMAEMINADHSEVVIGHSTTMNLYVLSNALDNIFSAGDEIIITNQDHESNITPWYRLAKRLGLTIKEWCLDKASSELLVDDLESLLTENTKLVCMPHSSNIIGSVNDVKRISDLVHTVGGLLLVDGVSYAPHHAIDVKDLGIDIYVLSLYKVFGPHLGLMFVAEPLHDQLLNQSLEFMPELYKGMTQKGAPNYLRIALNPGYVNHEEVASLLGLVDYFECLYKHHFEQPADDFNACVRRVFELIVKHQSELAEYFLSKIITFENLTLLGKMDSNTEARSPTYSFTTQGNKTLQLIAKQLADNNIAVQSGCFYAWRCLSALEINPDTGVLRISFAHFNTHEEVSRLLANLDIAAH